MMLSLITSTRDTWEELNFSEFLKHLESTVVELASNRDKSEASKNSLVQLTRDFRKSASEEVIKAVLSLLKSYQSEVDSSRKRCAYAEEAYLTVYKKLMDLPDPTLALTEVQGLQKKASKCGELECEVRRLKESNDQLKSEVNASKHFEQENIRLQRSLDELTQKLSSQLKEKCAEIEENNTRLLVEKEQELLVLKAEMEGKLHSMEEKVFSLTNALEFAQSELLKKKLEADKSETGKSLELDILWEDFEKANNRIRELEARLSSSGAPTFDTSSFTEQIVQLQAKLECVESDLQLKENEVAKFLSMIESLRKEKDSQQSTMSSVINDLEASLALVKSQLSTAEAQLKAQSNYSEVCRELELLRSIEFPDTGEVAGRGEPEGKVDTCSADYTFPTTTRPPLEVLLMHKNRALQNQLAELSSTNDRMKAELDRVQLWDAEARQQIREQSELITLLEADLYRAQTAMSRQPDFPTGTHSSALGGRMLAEAIGDDCSNSTVTPNLDPSLLRIVEHQRDRFRARTGELEQIESDLRQQLTTLQREVQAVRSDNVKLYEKIRFLQSYPSPTNRSVSFKASVPNSSINTGLPLVVDSVDQKYSQVYEANLDPFSQFSRQERQRHYQRLRPHDKILLKIIRLVVGNRSARLGAFLYALILHLLVFIALYNAVHFQNTADDAEASCLQRYADHMRSVHKHVVPDVKF